MDDEQNRVVFSGSDYFKVYRNGRKSGILANTGIGSPRDIVTIPTHTNVFYILDVNPQRIIVYNTSNPSIVRCIEPPDVKYPVTSITADDTYLYLGLNNSRILKLNTSDGQQVILSEMHDRTFSGLRRHPINGDLYILEHVITSSMSTSSFPSISSSLLSDSFTFSSWWIVRMDENLKVMSKLEVKYLAGEVPFRSSFAFDMEGMLYQLVPSKNSIVVIDTETGDYLHSLPLDDIVTLNNDTNFVCSIWISEDRSLYISLSDLNLVLHVAFNQFANYTGRILNTYVVENPTSVAVNSYQYVFVVSNSATLFVYSPTYPSSIVTSYSLGRVPDIDVKEGNVSSIDLWINHNDDVYIGRRNAGSIIIHSNISPNIPFSSSSSSSSSTGPYLSFSSSSSSSTNSSEDGNDKDNVGAIIGIVVGGAVVFGVLLIVLIRMKCRRNSKRKLESDLVTNEEENEMEQLR